MKNEIFSYMYAESFASLEVHVKEEDCPKPDDKRSNKHLSSDQELMTCHCMIGLIDRTPPCPYFKKIKQVQRNKEKVFKVFCSALEN